MSDFQNQIADQRDALLSALDMLVDEASKAACDRALRRLRSHATTIRANGDEWQADRYDRAAGELSQTILDQR